MKTKLSIILLLISLALLIIYGTDVLASKKVSQNLINERSFSNETTFSTSGFLKMKESIRGGLFGGGAVILSVLAFAISLREWSWIIVILLLINGVLIVGGMTGLYIQSLQQTTVNGHYTTVFGTMGLGILLVALGIVKIFVPRNRKMEKQT
ncbi:MAG TPA: hypothetical protein VF884_02790 [Nitrososphaeraceae archaeon]